MVAMAFGAINGVSTGKIPANTCMITGHLHKLGNDCVDCLVKGSMAAAKPTFEEDIGIMAAFFAGIARCFHPGVLPHVGV